MGPYDTMSDVLFFCSAIREFGCIYYLLVFFQLFIYILWKLKWISSMMDLLKELCMVLQKPGGIIALLDEAWYDCIIYAFNVLILL